MALKQKLKKRKIYYFSKNFQVPMGPFPTCKGPEGDKLQGMMRRGFFVSILELSIQSFKKIVRAVFCQNCEKVLFWPKFAPFGPKMGEGDFFPKSASFTFLHFWLSNFMPNFKKIVRAVFWENVCIIFFWQQFPHGPISYM